MDDAVARRDVGLHHTGLNRSAPRERPLIAIVRRKERVLLPERPGAQPVAYRFESLDFPATERRFHSYYAEFSAVDPGQLAPHAHPGAELIYVLTGTLSVHIDGAEHALEAGDSMYFDSSLPHGYRGAAAAPAARSSSRRPDPRVAPRA